MIPKFTLRNQHDDAAQRINSYDKKKDEKKSFKYSSEQGILPTTEQTVYFCMGSQLITSFMFKLSP